MSEEFGLGVLKIFAEILVYPIIRQFSYVCFYKSNMEDLERGAHKLQDKSDAVKQAVDAAGRNLEIVAPDVTSWIKEVEAAKLTANALLGGAEKVEKGCLYGSCPNLKQRYLLSRKATKHTISISKLQEEGNNYAKISFLALPASMTSSSVSPIAAEIFESRASTTKQVLEYLKNDHIHIIGLCGLGGVGKTTIVNEVRKQARAENLFDEVVMAVVSQNPDWMNIQDQLAGMMGLKLDDRISTRVRGEKVRERITQCKRVLVILDDVWGILSYDDLGIPVQGCKIVLTSRSDQVCRSMNAQHIIQVKLLHDEEAWDLFKSKAGDCIESIDIKSTAKKVLKVCGGLPLAIVTVGAALNSKEKYAWLDALEQLKTCAATNIEGMEMYVYSSLRLSYNYLQSDQIKQLFLLCCLFKEDSNIQIEHLVRYAAGLSLFRDIQKLEATRRRVKSFVDQLKGCYLVMEADKEGCIKLHDVVRAFGLVVASDIKHAYFVKHDPNMKEWPQNDLNEDYKAISLSSEEELEFPSDLKYPSLELLQLCAGGTVGAWSVQSSGNHFEGMKKLRVAAFMKMFICPNLEAEAPRKAVAKLFTNLRTLCLEYCNVECNISLITSLPKLEILSFYNSKITEVPFEIAQANSLKLLDLRGTPMCSFQPGILSNLKKLEELYMGFLSSDLKSYDILMEVNSLSSLVVLVIRLKYDGELVILKDLFDRLIRFDISLLSYSLKYMDREYKSPNNNRVVLNVADIGTLHAANINGLLKNTEELCLTSIRNLKDIVKDIDKDNFVNLKTLRIGECGQIEAELGNEMLPAGSFGRLEEVTLADLPLMTCFWKGVVRHPRLTNLRVIMVYRCLKLRTLFPVSIAKFLLQFEEIDLHSCDKLEEVFHKEEANQHEEKDGTIIVLPKMKYLCLDRLPRFTSFLSISDNTNSEDVVERPFLHQVKLPNLEKLVFKLDHKKNVVGGLVQSEICKLRVLKIRCSDVQIVRADHFQLLHNLEKLNVYYCHLLESIFDLKGIKVEETIRSKLGSLKLKYLPLLTHVWTEIPIGFQGFENLRILKIVGCNSLRYVLSSSMARILVNLELIRIDRCDQMEVIIQQEVISEEIDHILLPRLERLEISTCNKISDLTLALLGEEPMSLKTIKSFQKLKSVTIFNCNNLTNLLSPSMANSLVNLHHIDVRYCGNLVEAMREDKDEKLNRIVFPQLQSLRFERLCKLEVFFSGNLEIEFPCLDSVLISRCPEMASFCSGVLIAPKVSLVDCRAGVSEWNGDLNSTIQHIYQTRQVSD